MNDCRQDLQDELLVIRSRQGEVDAFRELVQRWQKRLWSHAFRMTRDESAAWDIVQDAWKRIMEGLPRLEDAAAFPCWALRIANNLAVDWIRREIRRRDAHEFYAQDRAATGAERRVAVDAVRAAMVELADADRQVIALFYIEGFSIAELADALGLPEGTVKSRLHYARERLKAVLAGGIG